MFHRGGVCCGKTPAAHAMEYKMMARNPRSGGTEVWQLSLGARDPIQFSIPHTCGVIPALAMWSFLPKWQRPAEVALPIHGFC